MIICGIDPGTRFTGYGLLEIKGNQISYLAHGTISPKGDDLPQRLKTVHLGIAEVLEKFSPAEVAVETSFYAKNAQTALKLGQVRGVIVLAASLLDIPVFEYTPTEVKKATCGYGRADKEQIGSMVAALLKMPKISSHDASDALAVGICHSSSRKIRRLAI